MALVWIAPLFARQLAEWTTIPLGLMTVIAVPTIVLRRALVRASAAPR